MFVVWIRRDARLCDHGPLHTAIQSARAKKCAVLVLYIYDPAELSADTFHESHLIFINAGLHDLDTSLKTIGGRLTLRIGAAENVFSELHSALAITAVYLHTDVETALCSARVRAVRNWARASSVLFNDGFRQDGVIPSGRPLNGWATFWSRYMSAPMHPTPSGQVPFVDPADIPPGKISTPDDLSLWITHRGTRPWFGCVGGEAHSVKTLKSFISDRVRRYTPGLSSPVTGWDACSRLSAYLSWGHISLRMVFQTVSEVQTDARNGKQRTGLSPIPLKCLSGFTARLRWRSHFCQKLHDAPCTEYENVCRVFDGLSPPRLNDFNDPTVQKWVHGRTGYPLVDACMRSLHLNGWLNFRMRAMVVSFAAYMLWVDWKCIAGVCARLFIDFAPGIHYPQLQMQAGTTGINALRMYNPTKQANDHDPKGVFIRRFVPELTAVPDQYIAAPWTMPIQVQRQANCTVGNKETDRYPSPIVDMRTTYKAARGRFQTIRSSGKAKEQKEQTLAKHGSRKRARQQGETMKEPMTGTGQKRKRACSVCGKEDHIKGPKCSVYMTRQQELQESPGQENNGGAGVNKDANRPAGKYRQTTLSFK